MEWSDVIRVILLIIYGVTLAYTIGYIAVSKDNFVNISKIVDCLCRRKLNE